MRASRLRRAPLTPSSGDTTYPVPSIQITAQEQDMNAPPNIDPVTAHSDALRSGISLALWIIYSGDSRFHVYVISWLSLDGEEGAPKSCCHFAFGCFVSAKPYASIMKKSVCAAANHKMPARVRFALPANPSPAAGRMTSALMSQTLIV